MCEWRREQDSDPRGFRHNRFQVCAVMTTSVSLRKRQPDQQSCLSYILYNNIIHPDVENFGQYDEVVDCRHACSALFGRVTQPP